MKIKIFGIIVCILLLSSYISIAENNQEIKVDILNKKLSNSSMNAETPIWTVGVTWTYKMDNMVIDYEESGQSVHLILNTDELKLNVISVTADSYVVQINAKTEGSGYFNIDLGDGPINITLNLKDTKLTGTVVFNKTDLGIKQLNPKLVGRLIIDVIEQPYNDKNIPPIPIKVTINTTITDLSTPLTIINFPLDVGNIWGMPSANISIDGTIKSPWLYLLNFVNNLARNNWNIAMKLANKIGIDEETAQKISDMLVDILPIINISYVLQNYLEIGNMFETPEIPSILRCVSIEDIIVQGKSYNAYNITAGYLGNIYYAQDAGNIVKISGHFKDVIPFISDLNIELIETNYQP